MRRIITFLGIQAKKTTYSFEGNNYDGEVFAEALHQFCNYESMLVCVTNEAKKKNFPILEKLEDSRIQAVDIPNGETTEQMWETFKIITEKVNQNDYVIFDITHGLRSLPFLVFLFAAYLKAAKNVTIEAIYYGAWELGFSNNGIAPVIDLSEFVSMIDWLTATDQFVQTGDAQRLAKLLNPDGRASNITKKAATTLSEVSLATLLCQPLQLTSKAQNLESDLLKAQEQLQLTAPPFEMLRQRITDTFSNFIGDFQQDTKKALEAQFRLIMWYHGNNRLIEAMSLAREWLINAVNYRLGLPFTLKMSNREHLISRAISGLEKFSRNDLPLEDLNEYGRIIHDSWAEKDDLIQLWNALQPVRNGLDHAGHQDGAMSISKIVKTSNEKIKPLLYNLAKIWELEELDYSERIQSD